MKSLVLVSGPGEQDQGTRILEFAEWMGVPTRIIAIGSPPAIGQLATAIDGGGCSVAISAETLLFLRESLPPGSLQDFIENRCARLLVFCVGESGRDEDLICWLTNGAVCGLAAPEERQVLRFPESGRRFSGAFASQTLTVRQPRAISTFDIGSAESPDLEKIMLADDHPMFLRLERGACEVFLVALSRLPDINAQLSPTMGVEEYYDQVIPVLIVLRHWFEEVCWQGAGRTARLIIDDPLLQPTYGFLNFGALRESMLSAGYGTSMAFIPWNHWRTSRKRAAELFDQNANLSICVHGCDHTNNEFGELDPGALQWKAGTALRRMEQHERRTGLGFEPVMVFPQGKFSTAAILALRSNGYLAAVNTTCFPTNTGVEPLTIADFLRPAITKFHGFPVFQRRYPRRLIDFAFDVFLGRPVLIVQHHQDFQYGYQQFETFVSGLHRLEPGLRWGSLSCELMRSCMVRSPSEHSTEVRFFTRKFSFRGFGQPSSGPTKVVFSKEEPDASAISKVLVDGMSVPFSFTKDLLIFEHQADAGRAIEVEVLDRPRPAPATVPRLKVTHTMGVPVRRVLSEFRDSTLVKYPRLLAAATGLATRMGVTGKATKNE